MRETLLRVPLTDLSYPITQWKSEPTRNRARSSGLISSRSMLATSRPPAVRFRRRASNSSLVNGRYPPRPFLLWEEGRRASERDFWNGSSHRVQPVRIHAIPVHSVPLVTAGFSRGGVGGSSVLRRIHG